MNNQPTPDPVPAVPLCRRDVAAVARRRAAGKSWSVVVEELEIPPEHHQTIDLLPLFHPDWTRAYAEAVRMAEEALFAEAQLVTRRQIRYAEEPKVRRAAIKRARRYRTRRGVRSRTPAVNPDGALAHRLARGETLEAIGQGYLAGLPDGIRDGSN